MPSATRTKRLVAAVAALGAAACVAGFAYAGETTAAGGEGASTAGTQAEQAAAGLIAQHAAIGQDISSVKEVSIQSCSPCHGDWDSIVAATADLWEPLGQITAANPHASHASAAFECEDCHSLTAVQTLQCGACHEYFELPEGWRHKDPTTSVYGTQEQPLYASTLD